MEIKFFFFIGQPCDCPSPSFQGNILLFLNKPVVYLTQWCISAYTFSQPLDSQYYCKLLWLILPCIYICLVFADIHAVWCQAWRRLWWTDHVLSTSVSTFATWTSCFWVRLAVYLQHVLFACLHLLKSCIIMCLNYFGEGEDGKVASDLLLVFLNEIMAMIPQLGEQTESSSSWLQP